MVEISKQQPDKSLDKEKKINRKIGELLIDAGLISDGQLNTVLDKTEKRQIVN